MKAVGRNYARFEFILSFTLREVFIIRYSLFIIHYSVVSFFHFRSKTLALNVYEGMFILDSGRYARDPEGVAAQVNKLVTDAGGEILVSRQWEERRLAYPIKGQRKGLYWLMYFRLDSANLADLNRQFSLYDVNIRNLFIKIDPRIVDELVKHAEVGPAAFQDRQLPETEDEEINVEDYEDDEEEDEE